MVSFEICLFLSNLLHLVLSSLGPSMLLQMALFYSFFFLWLLTPNLLIPTSVLFQLYWTGCARHVPVPALWFFRVLVVKASVCSLWCCCWLTLENLWSRHTETHGVNLCPSRGPCGSIPERGEGSPPVSVTPETRNGLEGWLALAFLRMGQEEGKSQKEGHLHHGWKHEL